MLICFLRQRRLWSSLKSEAYRDGGVHLIHEPLIHMAHMLPQTPFVDGADLLEQHHRVLGKSHVMPGKRALPDWLVIAAAITVGECLFPVSFCTIKTGLVPPCSLPTTGLRSA